MGLTFPTGSQASVSPMAFPFSALLETSPGSPCLHQLACVSRPSSPSSNSVEAETRKFHVDTQLLSQELRGALSPPGLSLSCPPHYN